ncbi:MAG TPA: alanine racemase [Terriglobales bacterium]|nr:alanine racemase [Terriglobales bacterium]
MIPTRLETIAEAVAGELRGDAAIVVDRICTDSRGASRGALFVALKGEQTDGHRFLADAFRNGASAALVSMTKLVGLAMRPERPLIVVADTLRALQALAGWHRRKYLGKVVAITGSNGKTIVKDALRTLLAGRDLLASPGSYNSQLGLPLAILSAEKPEPLAILEVGISAPGEMAPLEAMAAPDFGILTNIGLAHFAAFGSREAIAREKMLLFRNIGKDGWLLIPASETSIAEPLRGMNCSVYEVGSKQLPAFSSGAFTEEGQVLELRLPPGEIRTINVKTRSAEIISDLHIAACAAHLLGATLDEIAAGLEGYTPPPTRVELWSSPQGIRLINDGYSADPISVQAALRSAALSSGRSGRKIFAFAGMRELGATSDREHRQVGSQAGELGFSHLFLVGEGELQSTADGFSAATQNGQVARVQNPEQLKEQLLPLLRPGDTVLFKGPRNSGMVKAVRDLSGAIAQRCQWINLAAIESNIARFRRHCGGAHVMAMLKAMAYGTDLAQLAGWMSRLGVRHIGVSSANEGVAARKSGAGQDIFVFLSEPEDLDNLLRYRLTPVIYSGALVESFAKALAGTGQSLDIHLKVDTGMHRLGVTPEEALALAQKIRSSGSMRLRGVCTHFAAADDPQSDEFTRQQIAVFDDTLAALRREGFNDFIVHAANTAAAVRFPQARYDMVRIGLGLYGIYPSDAVREELELELAIGVTSRITSIQEFAPGATLGYSRTFTATRKTRVGVVPFGYDDGLPWGLSGKGQVLVEGRPAPLVGRISMDQMQVDITDLPGIGVGAEVLLYGSHNGHTLRPELVADQAGTISHELLTRLGERVHRIYVEP